MDDLDVVPTSDTEEQEALQADAHTLEYFEVASEKIKHTFAEYAVLLNSFRNIEKGKASGSSREQSSRDSEGRSPPRKRTKLSEQEPFTSEDTDTYLRTDDPLTVSTQDGVDPFMEQVLNPLSPHRRPIRSLSLSEDSTQKTMLGPAFIMVDSSTRSLDDNALSARHALSARVSPLPTSVIIPLKRKISRLRSKSPEISNLANLLVPPESSYLNVSSSFLPSGEHQLVSQRWEGAIPLEDAEAPPPSPPPLVDVLVPPSRDTPTDPVMLFTPLSQHPGLPQTPLLSPLSQLPSSPAVDSRTEIQPSPSPMISTHTLSPSPPLHNARLELPEDFIPPDNELPRRYALRERQARQINPYKHDKYIYKQQLRSNPDAIVSVVSPSRRRRGSPRRHGSAEDSGTDPEAEHPEDEDDDIDEDRFWRKHGSRTEHEGNASRAKGKSKSKSKEPDHGRSGPVTASGQVSPLGTMDTSFLRDIFHSDDDLEPLPGLSRITVPVQEGKGKKPKRRTRPFPLKDKELMELKIRFGDELDSEENIRTRRPQGFSPSRSPDNFAGQDEVISISDGPADSRAPSPAPLHDYEWDAGIRSPILDIASEIDLPPTSSLPHSSRPGSAGDFNHSEDDIVRQGSSSDDEFNGSDERGMTEAQRKADRRRKKQLGRMMPQILVNKLLSKAADQQSKPKKPVIEGSDSDSDKPLQPGQTRVRHGFRRTQSDIRGDPESSEEDIVESGDGLGGFAVRSPSPRSYHGESRMRHDFRPTRSVTVISLSSSSDEESGEGSEDIHEAVGRWVSAPSGQRRADFIKEGDLIDRMLSRTRVSSSRKKAKFSSARRRGHEGGAGGGGGRSSGRGRSGKGGRLNVVTSRASDKHQTSLPFKPLQRTSSGVSEPHFRHSTAGSHSVDLTEDDDNASAPFEQQIRDYNVVAKVLKPKDKKKMAKSHGLYTFASGNRPLNSGPTRPVAFSLEEEQELVQPTILQFVRKDSGPRRHHKSKSEGRLDLHPSKRRTSTSKDEDQVAAPSLSASAEMGNYTLPSGILFGSKTYLGGGWLQDLLAVRREGSHPVRPNAVTALDFFIPSIPSVDEFIVILNQVYDAVFLIARSGSTTLAFKDIQEWRRLLRCMCQHVSWFLASPADEGSIGTLSLSFTNQLRRASALVDEHFAVRADETPLNFLVFEIQWFAVELAFRAQAHPLTVGDYARPWHQISRLLRRLWAYGLQRSQNAINNRSPEGLDYFNPSLRISEIWICLIHLLQEGAADTLPASPFWKNLLDVIKDPATKTPHAVDLRASEQAWAGIFGLIALSQFSDRGVSSPTPRLPACWELVMDALERIRFETTAAQDVSRKALKARDRYIRLLFTRCMILRKTWGWQLSGSALVVHLFRRLLDVFKERHFSNLPTEASDFPNFLRSNNLQLLSQIAPKDTAFTLFLKLIVQAAQDTPQGARDSYISKILAITVPVGSVAFTKDKRPTKSDLSKLYNRFSVLAVVIHLLPLQENVEERISLARRYVKYNDADWETRRACIRGLQHLAILLKDLQLPLKSLLDWLAEMTDVLIDEYVNLSKHQLSSSLVQSREKEWCMVNIQLVLGCVSRIIKTEMSGLEHTQASQYPDPALLQGPWVVRVFAASTLTAVATTGDAIRNVVQAFLDARQVIVPVPPRPHLVAEEDSQQDYGEDDAFFDDPEVRAAMGENQSYVELREKETTVCDTMEKHIAPALFRLLCSKLDPPAANAVSFDDWCSSIDLWTECWVRCAGVLVQNKKRSWSSFLDHGFQSWERVSISNPARKRYIELCFMFRMLERDPTTYASEYRNRILSVFVQSLATPDLTLEHEYIAFVLSVDGLRHPLLTNFPFCERENESKDFVISREHFLRNRVAWIQHICNRFAENIASWDSALDDQFEVWTDHVCSMLSTMQRALELAMVDSARLEYLQFCVKVKKVLLAFPTLRDRARLKLQLLWLDTLG